MTQLVERRKIPSASPRGRRAPPLSNAGVAEKATPPRTLPAAYEWEDSSLPGVPVVRAWAWLPLALLAMCAVALVYLVQTSGVATTGYDLQHLQTQRAEWLLRNDQLRLELAKRRSLAWVESEATGRLGMIRPEQPVFLRAAGDRDS